MKRRPDTRTRALRFASLSCLLFGVLAAPARAQDAKTLWSLQKVADPEPPASSAADRGAIDRFLDARLRAASLRPTERADPHALLRRVTFDLTGLPPTPSEIRSFVEGHEAYAKVVDRLLASPAFGERWGRHWLDVVRFAESSGGGRSLMFEDAWRFRDYVIDAYNSDVAFDDFVTEQLAGDLLPAESEAQRNRQLIAAGFLELGPTNYELQDKELLRMDVIDEQIDTVGQAFLGMTLGCARCHDHKFDPVTARDYYALAGIFGSTSVLTSGNVSGWTKHELGGERARKWHDWKRRVNELRGQLKRLAPTKQKKRAQPRAKLDAAALEGIVIDDVTAEKVGVWIPSTHVKRFLGVGYIHDENTEKGEKSVRFAPRIPKGGDGRYEVRISYTPGPNRATNTPVRIEHADGRVDVKVDQRAEPDIDAAFVSLGTYRFTAGVDHSVVISNAGTDGHVIVDGLQLVKVGDATEPRPRRAGAKRTKIARLRRQLASLEKAQPARPGFAMAPKDVARPADEHFRVRGLVRSKGALVPRGYLGACGGTKPEIPAGQSGRLQLAQWLTSPTHPLTARVYVNRVWHWLFGTGIVRTVDNFGAKGERPSHPKLLDWLARRFMRRGWSTKKLIREIVMSEAYRRRVAHSPVTDPENRLLSHFPRRRLDAESLRDAILFISGRLDPQRGGKTIRKMAQYDYGYVFDSRRRSVYVPRFRSNRLRFFDIFDAPDPSMVAGARNVSNVAPQALFLMIWVWVMRQAREAARRHAAAGDDDALLDQASLQTLGRPPSEAERRITLRHLATVPREDAWPQVYQVLFQSLDFRYLR